MRADPDFGAKDLGIGAARVGEAGAKVKRAGLFHSHARQGRQILKGSREENVGEVSSC